MSYTEAIKTSFVRTISLEEALEVSAQLRDKKNTTHASFEIHSGGHTTFGYTHVLLPAIGYPIVIQEFNS